MRTIIMKTTFLLLVSTIALVLHSTGLVAGEATLKTINWSDLKASDRPDNSEILPAEPSQKGEVLKIEYTKDTPETIQLIEIKDPQITEASFAICGNIRYKDVQGKSYLEMWSHFPDGKKYFSRTLGEQGPMRNLEGSSDWRPFTVPFFLGKHKARPNRLVVSLVLKGSGTVYLSPLRLEQYAHQQQTGPMTKKPVLKTIDWSELKDSEKPRGGEVLPAEPPQKGKVLKIENAKSAPDQIQLFEIKDPQITEASFAICGNIRYKDVQGKSYLEMWSHFPDGTQYFSRTLGEQGPMQSLEGSSDWRPFTVPFFMGQGKARPNRITVNLVLKGSGTVYLSPLRLEEHAGPNR